MDYSERYKADLVSALHNVDTDTIQRVIECFREARSRNRRIFVCASDPGGIAGAQFLIDTMRQVKPNKGQRLRIMNLNAQLPHTATAEWADERGRDRVILEELKTFAEPGDVVVGISASRNAASILNALEYAAWINCRTVAITGSEEKRLAAVATNSVRVLASHSATLEDAVMTVCHMIGHYFVDTCNVSASGA
jgi:D-sedoheptulose 7-phosphate isomerase